MGQVYVCTPYDSVSDYLADSIGTGRQGDMGTDARRFAGRPAAERCPAGYARRRSVGGGLSESWREWKGERRGIER